MEGSFASSGRLSNGKALCKGIVKLGTENILKDQHRRRMIYNTQLVSLSTDR